jgi:hypothetical protein
MTYQKPEVVPLGQATLLIQGGKSLSSETAVVLAEQKIPDSELDD